MKTIILVSVLLGVAFAHEVRLRNNCPFTVWPGIQGNPGKGQLEDGGFELGKHDTKVLHFANSWAGRIWGRTGCNRDGHCETGDCGNKIKCNGAGGVPPVSLAEVTFDGNADLDYYDISLVDGYNLPIKMAPIGKYELKCLEKVGVSRKCLKLSHADTG